jgi:glucoamylase
VAQYYIKNQQPDKSKEVIDWVIKHSSQSGMFAEQIDPENGNQIGVSPLVWSHASFIETVLLLSGIIS